MRIRQIRIIKVLIFFCCFFLIFFHVVNPVLKFKFIDGIEPWTEFYEMEEDSLDVLLFGSSHMFATVNPAVLWDEAGIPSFVIGGGVQPMWNTYYSIKECLKYQSPKLIIIESYGAIFDTEYRTYHEIIKNNFGLRFSKTKIESIMVSSPRVYWADLFLEFPTYHDRYKELDKYDFVKFTGRDSVYMNGYYSVIDYTEQIPVDVSGVHDKTELPEKQFEYLMKIIDLLEANDIELMIMVSPYIISANDQASFNAIEEIANNNNAKFVNYNLLYDELGLDFKTDMIEESHLSYSGGTKVSSNLANILKYEYGLENKKDKPGYEDWDEWAQEVLTTIDNKYANNDFGNWR